MSEPLQHDPKTKQQIKDVLYDLLYSPIQRRYQERLNKIIIQNAVAGKLTHRSFIFKNEIYNCDTDPLPRKMNRLLPQFVPEMEEYIKDVNQLNNTELPYVLGFINQVLNSSNELHDYLRLFPENLHAPIRHLIDTCPCRTKSLSADDVFKIQGRNQSAIELMKQRMAINLII